MLFFFFFFVDPNNQKQRQSLQVKDRLGEIGRFILWGMCSPPFLYLENNEQSKTAASL